MKKILTIFSLVVLIPGFVFAYVSPGKPTGYVNDFANVISANDKTTLESQLSSFAKTGAAEISVVTIPALGDETIENFAVKLFAEWGIGKKGNDNGILILVAPNDRQARIEVGYGLEGAVTDIQSGNVINKVMIPAFKLGDYSGGIKGSVDAVIEIISGSPEAALYSTPLDSNSGAGKSSGLKINFEVVLFLLFFIGSVLGRFLGKTKSWWLGGVLGAGVGAIIGLIWGFLYYGLGTIIVLGILGLIFDYFVSKGGGHGGKGPFGGLWFGPGMGGGSSGFGGGGFGGFGGGMSGGGGASGRW